MARQDEDFHRVMLDAELEWMLEMDYGIDKTRSTMC